MRISKMGFMALLLAVFMAGCGSMEGDNSADNSGDESVDTSEDNNEVKPGTTGPTVISTSPVNAATGVAINTNILASFSEAMNASTINTATFTLRKGKTLVSGSVSSPSTTTATFNPTFELATNTTYTATVTTGAENVAGDALAVNKKWNFKTRATATAAGPQPVDLGLAGNYVILTKAGISTVPASVVTGDMGVSPIGYAAITGFTLIPTVPNGSNTFSTSSQVTGKVYASDYSSPTPTNLTTAVSNMEAAYTDAAGRPAGVGPFLNVGGGTVSGLTLVPGVYTWGTNVNITSDLTLSGGANDVWIFQIAGTLDMAAAQSVILSGGALPKNIFWQVAGAVTLLGDSHFEGIILGQTNIAMVTGASINGRLLAQTAVTLDQNAVTKPAP